MVQEKKKKKSLCHTKNGYMLAPEITGYMSHDYSTTAFSIDFPLPPRILTLDEDSSPTIRGLPRRLYINPPQRFSHGSPSTQWTCAKFIPRES